MQRADIERLMSAEGAESAPAAASTATAVAPAPPGPPGQMTPWHVILLDDDFHTYDYVIRMVRSVFGYTEERAYQLADEVNAKGRAVCMTTHKELAELKRDQLLSFGKDPLIAMCKGSMSATIEPAQA